MIRYENQGGSSGIVGYQTGPDRIAVMFRDGWGYLYDYASAGRGAVERMKSLAAAGRGLNGYINRAVRNRYALKERFEEW